MKKLLKITLTLFLTAIIVLGFALPLNPVGNWYQQFFPDLGGRQINDITFTDSLNGYAVTSRVSNTSYILKTSNGGNNWSILYTDTNDFTCLQFLNKDTGYVGGLIRMGFAYYILKTTNGGLGWLGVSTPSLTYQADMHVLNNDTIWYAMDEISSGGVFRTTNGGVNWSGQPMTNGNPDRIYMYDRNLGFAATSTVLYRTTNSGVNWVLVTGTDGFDDIQFVNSQTGWKASGFIRKTTNGGLNWMQQIIPSGGIISGSSIRNIHALNSDTIWGVGGTVEYPNLQTRGIVYRTINGGNNWLFQIPDTSINIYGPYFSIQFINSKTGWAYNRSLGGIHTTTGGDTGWVTPIKQISTEIPKEFKLFQNYPNPFNPESNIKYQISKNNVNIKIVVHDITGKETAILVNERQNSGTYETEFNGSGYSSGIYFYSLIIDNKIIETRKMILLK